MAQLSILTTILLLSFVASVAHGKPATVSEVSSRACLRPVSGNAADVRISTSGVKFSGGNQTHKDVVASALSTVSIQSEGRLDSVFKGLSVNIVSSVSQSARAAGSATRNVVQLKADELLVSRNKAVGEATVVHELGHVLSRRKNLQPAYDSQVDDCNLTTYCTHTPARNGAPGPAHGHRREEFAEVFAAYIFHSDALKSQCPSAYNFMKAKVFGTDARSSASCKPMPEDRSYETADGRVVKIGDGVAPEGYSAQTNAGIDLNGIAQFIQLTALTQREQEQKKAQEQMITPSDTTTPASGEGTRVIPEQLF